MEESIATIDTGVASSVKNSRNPKIGSHSSPIEVVLKHQQQLRQSHQFQRKINNQKLSELIQSQEKLADAKKLEAKSAVV
jgi:hypothetical protein